MNFQKLSQFLQTLEQLNSRNEITVAMSEFFNELKTEEIKPVMYLLQGRLVPKYVDLEFNFSRKLLFRSLENLIKDNFDEKYVDQQFSVLGDVGLVAEKVIEERKKLQVASSKLKVKNAIQLESKSEILEVYELLLEIAKASGKGSQEMKMNKYIELIQGLDLLGVRYVSRMIVGELRLGVSDKTILDSLSWFLTGDKSVRKTLDASFGAKSDVGELAEIVIGNKDIAISKLKNIKLEPGVPVASKLVERESSSETVWERMPECFVQPKLDGLRGQIHMFKIPEIKNEEAEISEIKAQVYEGKVGDKVVQIYSRNMENMTDQFPDIVEAVKKLPYSSLILDSEIIGYDIPNNKYLTYQETMQRRRKYDIESYAKDIPVKAMCFDVLYLDGKDLTNEGIELRVEKLKSVVGGQWLVEKTKNKNTKEQKDDGSQISNLQSPVSNLSVIDMLETKQMKSVEELEEYFQDKIGKGLEGIITKQKESNYEPGTRNFKWIKLKANTQSHLVDTIDVAVVGYFVGTGQRAKYGIGALLTAVYDTETDKYYTIGKVGSGMTELQLEIIQKDLAELKVDAQPENVIADKLLIPYQWVKPKIVMEIVADEITRSPSSPTAKGIPANVPKDDSSRGLSIRFPRLKIWKRDKDLPNTVGEVLRMYELRKAEK